MVTKTMWKYGCVYIFQKGRYMTAVNLNNMTFKQYSQCGSLEVTMNIGLCMTKV